MIKKFFIQKKVYYTDEALEGDTVMEALVARYLVIKDYKDFKNRVYDACSAFREPPGRRQVAPTGQSL